MIRYRNYVAGKIAGLIYDFESAGDALPEHAHEAELCHNCIVMRGAITVARPDGAKRMYMAGDIAEFAPGERHRIEAAWDHTRTLHLLYHADASVLGDAEGVIE